MENNSSILTLPSTNNVETEGTLVYKLYFIFL